MLWAVVWTDYIIIIYYIHFTLNRQYITWKLFIKLSFEKVSFI